MNGFGEWIMDAETWVFKNLLSDDWIRFPRCFLFMMSHQEALLLSYLIGSWSAIQRAKDEPVEWFYRKIDRTCKDLNVTVDQQDRWMRRLKRLGVISTKRQGMPSRRFIRINFGQIRKLAEEAIKKENKKRVDSDY